MEATLASRLPEIDALCREFGVQHLSLFGSAATDSFRPESSDYDFLVELDEAAPGSKAARWIGLAEAIEQLLGRHVDLVDPRYIENPIFRRAVESSRVTIYDRTGAEGAFRKQGSRSESAIASSTAMTASTTESSIKPLSKTCQS